MVDADNPALEASRGEFVLLQKNLNKLNKQMERFDQDKKMLDKSISQNRTEAEEVHKKLSTTLETYSHLLSHQISSRLPTTLPRELRDEIYNHLVVPPSQTLRIPHVDDPLASWALDTIYRHPGAYVPTLPPLMPSTAGTTPCTPTSLDPSVYRELVETLYRRNVFYVVNVACLRDFLGTDVHGLGVVPGAVVRRVRVAVPLRCLDGTSNAVARRRVAGERNGRSVAVDPEELCAVVVSTVEECVPVENREGLRLEIVLTGSCREVGHELVVLVGRLVWLLRDLGVGVGVLHKGGKRLKGWWERIEKSYVWPGRDWTHLFDVSREEWERRVRERDIYEKFVPEDQ